jgi:hypothetical protein
VRTLGLEGAGAERLKPNLTTTHKAYSLAAQNRVHLGGSGALERRQYVRVGVQREADLAMSQRLHDRPRIHAQRQQQRCCGVPQIMEPNRGLAREYKTMLASAGEVRVFRILHGAQQ